jgi:hypothetical protein
MGLLMLLGYHLAVLCGFGGPCFQFIRSLICAFAIFMIFYKISVNKLIHYFRQLECKGHQAQDKRNWKDDLLAATCLVGSRETSEKVPGFHIKGYTLNLLDVDQL